MEDEETYGDPELIDLVVKQNPYTPSPAEEILKKVISKAVENGWKPFPKTTELKPTYENVMDNWCHMPVAFLVRHDFAKAFFGENWMPRLAIMVLEEEPLTYLKKFL